MRLHHYTSPQNLAGIYEQGQLLPHLPDPPWLSGDKAVVMLTDGGPGFWSRGGLGLVRVTVEVERSEVTFCNDDPSFRAADNSIKHDPCRYRRACREWYWSEQPIPAGRIVSLVIGGRRYGSATYDGDTLHFEPFKVAS